MKRLYSMLICFVLMVTCFPSSVAAEEFSLRNGIMFGDTMDIILTKEKTLKRSDDTSNCFKGRIAGYSNAECVFVFDDDGKLIDMRYFFGEDICTSRDSMNDVYKTIYQSLNRQYGRPLGNTGGACHLITGSAFETMALFVYLLGSLDGYSADYTDYDEWVIDSDSYHVKIDMVSYYIRDDKYDYRYMVSVSYKVFTDEDFDDALRQKQGEREEVDSDF